MRIQNIWAFLGVFLGKDCDFHQQLGEKLLNTDSKRSNGFPSTANNSSVHHLQDRNGIQNVRNTYELANAFSN